MYTNYPTTDFDSQVRDVIEALMSERDYALPTAERLTPDHEPFDLYDALCAQLTHPFAKGGTR